MSGLENSLSGSQITVVTESALLTALGEAYERHLSG
jgi:hypothetical protein